jgi:hypothetical protein
VRLIERSDYQNFPDDDEEAFIALVELAEKRLNIYLATKPEVEHSQLKIRYANIISEAVVAYKVGDKDSLPAVPHERFSEDLFDSFKISLERMLTRIMISQRRLSRSDLVELKPTGIQKIRETIDELSNRISSSEIPKSRREKINILLHDIKVLLEKDRFDLSQAMKKLTIVLQLVSAAESVAIKLPDAVKSVVELANLYAADVVGMLPRAADHLRLEHKTDSAADDNVAEVEDLTS